MTIFDTAKIPKVPPIGLTNLELLLYSVICANCTTKGNICTIELKPEQLKNFLSSPTQTKINTLVKKGILNKIDKHIYTFSSASNDGYKFKSNKYKDTKALLYGLINALGNTGITAENLSSIIKCHPSTITKTLKGTEGIYGVSHWLNNNTGGKFFKWYIGDCKSKEHPSRPKFILYHKDITDNFDYLQDKIIASYLYTISLTSTSLDVEELNYILKTKVSKKKIKEIQEGLVIPSSLIGRAIRIPLYSDLRGLPLFVTSLISEYRLRGMNAIWSLNTFVDMFGITTKEANLACKYLLKKKKISKPSKEVIQKWREYIGSTNTFSTATTVTKEQNIILRYCL